MNSLISFKIISSSLFSKTLFGDIEIAQLVHVVMHGLARRQRFHLVLRKKIVAGQHLLHIWNVFVIEFSQTPQDLIKASELVLAREDSILAGAINLVEVCETYESCRMFRGEARGM